MLTLTIHTGNDAMRTRKDLAQALSEAAHKIRNGHEYGKIFDLNGNSVGEFNLWDDANGNPSVDDISACVYYSSPCVPDGSGDQ